MREHLHFIRIRGLEAQNAQLTARLDALEESERDHKREVKRSKK